MSDIRKDSTLPSALYVVATPIGNREDLTYRAKAILASVDCILAEDTRVTGHLLSEMGIKTRLISFNAHSEEGKSHRVIEALESGQAIALVSDAGTPGISDPGRLVVAACLQQGLSVVPVPGASALAAAISVSGLPAAPFHFFGFLPAKGGARDQSLGDALAMPGTVIFYEAPHRIVDLAKRLDERALGRAVVFARELTKTFEQIVCVDAGQCERWCVENPDRIRGEFVVLVGPDPDPSGKLDLDSDRLLRVLARELPPSRAAAVAAELTGQSKRELYRQLTDVPSE